MRNMQIELKNGLIEYSLSSKRSASKNRWAAIVAKTR
jgi:hypothetical protein